MGPGGHGSSPDFCLFEDCTNEIRRELDGEGRREDPTLTSCPSARRISAPRTPCNSFCHVELRDPIVPAQTGTISNHLFLIYQIAEEINFAPKCTVGN